MRDSRFRPFGLCPAQVAAPRTVGDAQALVRQSQGRSLLPWGGGTRQHIGSPPARTDMVVSTEHLDAITEYAPADMVVTAEAGVRMADLQNALAAHGQWLPLHVAQPDIQTLGGVVAARAGSLTRMAHGSVRDHLIGVTVINHLGDIIKGGGKVVKNVAGYDLPKLYCGSWGTLGLIADVTFKVAPLPAASATALLPLPENVNSEETLDALAASDLCPSLLCLLSPQAARDIFDPQDNAQYLIIGFDDTADAVAWQIETLGAPGVLPDAIGIAMRIHLRDFPLRAAPMACVFHILPSQVGAYSRMMEWTARRHGFTASVVSDAGLGIVHAQFAPLGENADWLAFYADLRDKADRVGGSCILERMPAALREINAPVWSPVLPDFALMQGIKRALDPGNMWNPGRFVGGL